MSDPMANTCETCGAPPYQHCDCVPDAMDVASLRTRLAQVEKERDRFHTALTKISSIRDSIVGMQGFNFSEHAYPLVAALDEAGFKGAGYEISRRNLGTLIEQRDKAEAERDAALTRVKEVEAERDEALREADRWRHGATVEGDFVCPNQLQLDAALARVREVEARLAEVSDLSLKVRSLQRSLEMAERETVERIAAWLENADAVIGDARPIALLIRNHAYRTEGSK